MTDSDDKAGAPNLYPPELRALRAEFNALRERIDTLLVNIPRLIAAHHFEEAVLLEREFREKFERANVVLQSFNIESEAWFARVKARSDP
jgi:hypothetical protein